MLSYLKILFPLLTIFYFRPIYSANQDVGSPLRTGNRVLDIHSVTFRVFFSLMRIVHIQIIAIYFYQLNIYSGLSSLLICQLAEYSTSIHHFSKTLITAMQRYGLGLGFLDLYLYVSFSLLGWYNLKNCIIFSSMLYVGPYEETCLIFRWG